ncbi:MAG: carboxypeptidase-like regulatory domain-containing protein [Ekhidna sp.]
MKHLLFLITILNSFVNPYISQAQVNSENVRESVYVHTDRHSYVVGETIWFKVYAKSYERSWDGQQFRETNSPSRVSKVAYVEVLNSKNEAILQQSIKLEDGMGQGSLYVPFSVNTAGYRLRCYTRWMRNDSPEKYFEKFVSIINPLVSVSDKSVRIVSNTQSTDSVSIPDAEIYKPLANKSRNLEVVQERRNFSTREKVSLKLKNLADKKDAASLSVSVYKIDALDKFASLGIVGYFENSESATTKKEEKFVAEYEGQMITGVVTACDGNVVPGKIIYLYNKGENTIIYTARTDDEGKFLFITSEFIPRPNVQIKPEKADDCFKILIDPAFSDEFSTNEIPSFTLTEGDLNAISKRSVYMQVNNTSKDEFTQIDSLNYINFFESEYTTYRLDDYTRFSSLETTFKEYISEVAVSNKKGDLSFRIKNEDRVFNRADPLILIDGAVIADPNMVKQIHPSKIDRIQVGVELYLIGEVTFYGVIGIFTKSGVTLRFQNASEYSLPSNQGLLTPLFPKYETDLAQSSPKPDFRTLLYWNGDLALEETQDVEFYTSDVPGTYKGVIEGISASGELFSESFTFSVK